MALNRPQDSGLIGSEELFYNLGLWPASVILRCLFIKTKDTLSTFSFVYVNDIIITGTSNVVIQQLTTKLHSNFSLKQLGKLDYFLGIEIKSLADGTILWTQSKYTRDLLQKTKMA